MIGRVLVEALMWTMVVEVALVGAEHGTGVALVVDQHPIGALGPDAAHEPLRETVRARRARRCLDNLDVLSSEHRVERLANFESRSRIRNRKPPIRSPRSITRLRPCWVIHSAVGWAVTPRICTRRVAISITTSTYSRRRVIVST